MCEILARVRDRKLGIEDAMRELTRLGYIRNGNGERQERIKIILDAVIPRPTLTISEAKEELQWFSR